LQLSHNRTYVALGVILLLSFAACKREERCAVPIGITNFKIEPNAAYYSGLNNVGGYMYLTGGHRGVVVVRQAYDQFVAYERTCPADSTTAVRVSEEWGSALLECPKCKTCFIVASDGMPMDGGATTCPLYQYSTSYSGGILWVY
jgi:nitrite reductase/ring-hydroxylating ferredoxin subunit